MEQIDKKQIDKKQIDKKQIDKKQIDKKQIILQYYREQNAKRRATKDQRDRINKKQRERYHNSLYYQQRFTCDCGGQYTVTSKASHQKTKRHKDYLDPIINLEFLFSP